MAINRIKVSNFKSFKDLDIELGNFNVLIGANSSGKSNFIQILKFLSDITTQGLNNAVSMTAGDIGYLRNIIIGPSQPLSLKVSSDHKYRRLISMKKEKEPMGMIVNETVYKFTMKFNKKGPGFEIIEDKLIQKFDIAKLKIKDEKIKERENYKNGEIVFSNNNGNIVLESLKKPEGVEIEEDEIFPQFLREDKLKPKTLLIEHQPSFFMPPIFGEISIYDFDPKLPKKASSITGKVELEEDGSNLAIVLKNIIENRENRRKFANLVKDILPFVDKLDVDSFTDKSLLFKLQEVYTNKQYLPASLISDGTINITALIIALYFGEKPVVIIEEPERNIHPHLISKLVSMMKEVAQKKQIIVTTHNPEIVKNAGIENILFISRDKGGFSSISRLSEREEIKTFFKNEIGIEELYVQNLLGL